MGWSKCTCDRLCLSHVVSGISGVLFSVGWWFLIDAHSYYPKVMNQSRSYYAPGLVGTLAFVMVNSVPRDVLSNNIGFYNKWSICFTRTFLFLGFFLAFSALISGVFIFIYDFALNPTNTRTYMWIGVAVLLQNIFIILANFLFRLISNVNIDDFY